MSSIPIWGIWVAEKEVRMSSAAEEHQHHHACGLGGGTAVDPVCGMSVDPATTSHHAVHAGADYHFCSAKCRERFVARPGIFLDDSASPPPPTGSEEVIYTCPM